MRRVNKPNADASAKASQRRVVPQQSSVDTSYGPELKMISLSQLQDLDLCEIWDQGNKGEGYFPNSYKLCHGSVLCVSVTLRSGLWTSAHIRSEIYANSTNKR